MKKLIQKLEVRVDDYNIKKKFYLLYILCVLLPLIVTDSVIIYIVLHSEQQSRRSEMENISNAVQYSFYNSVDSAANLSKSIYMNKYINVFLDTEYESSLDYVVNYQNFFKDTMLENTAGMENVMLTMYSDNDSIVNGGEFERLGEVRDNSWYQYLTQSGLEKALYFDYDQSKSPAVEAKRKILFLQKLDFFSDSDREKIVKIELDYSTMTRNLVEMNYDVPVYLCWNDKIVLSNGKYTSVGKDFETFSEQKRVGYQQSMELYGLQMQIVVLNPEASILSGVLEQLPAILFLVLINVILPVIMMTGLHHSFTVRIGELSQVLNSVESEHLTLIGNVRGKDEIGGLMRNYNKMAGRINSLIQIVYKNKIQEQEMVVARQNAELLALHSQINPHFLFNALESIRMHSILKQEMETADMVEKLAIMQRQYVEWGEDLIEISREMEFVKAYLSLQKYRFGDRLCYELDVEEFCGAYQIPKLSIVTFVENACIHGIEKKPSQGWIFVRIFREEDWLCLEVEDTGCGMSEEEMQTLLARMQNASMEMLKEKGRVGIVNACLRLKRATEGAVQFELDGEEQMGTTVQIRIPIQTIM